MLCKYGKEWMVASGKFNVSIWEFGASAENRNWRMEKKNSKFVIRHSGHEIRVGEVR
jgi:hypothetical protein